MSATGGGTALATYSSASILELGRCMANNATKLPPIKFCRVAEHFSRRVPTTSTRIQATRFTQNLLPFCHCGWQPSYVRPTNLRKDPFAR
jgi:hypothetical protein